MKINEVITGDYSFRGFLLTFLVAFFALGLQLHVVLKHEEKLMEILHHFLVVNFAVVVNVCHESEGHHFLRREVHCERLF